MLKYWETNWKSEKGLETHRYEVTFNEVLSRSTVEEQKKRPERLSLVKFFDDKESNYFFDICRIFQKNGENFNFENNKKFHTTLLGFPIVDPKYYDAITERIDQFTMGKNIEMNIKLDLVRLGTKYQNNSTLNPVKGVSNGTVIGFGDYLDNREFITFGDKLSSFLVEDEYLNNVLGKKFRRRFPTIWCTMGYYTADFKVTAKLETLFSKYQDLDSHFFGIPCYELELGLSHYKDLRDWKRICTFPLPAN